MGGNAIIMGDKSKVYNCSITFSGHNHVLKLGDNVNLSNISFWFEDSNGVIEIGSGTTMEDGCQFASVEGTHVMVGEDCMFSHDIDVRSTDSHSILNEKGERINPSEDITIGNHVWVGIRSTILKGSHIADNSVVAACSLVISKTISKHNTVLAGHPAKIVKESINWDRKRI